MITSKKKGATGALNTDENSYNNNNSLMTNISPTVTTTTISTKENTGESAKIRQRRKILMGVILVVVFYMLCWLVFEIHFAGYWLPDVEIMSDGQSRVRRRPERQYSKMNPDQKATTYDAILEGYLTLVDIDIPPDALQGMGGQYVNVKATFCNIDWRLQKKNPSNVPMFRDLRSQSKMCPSTTVNVDLFDIVQSAKLYDKSFSEPTKTKEKIGNNKGVGSVVAVPPTGVVFHETRCGSTLFANLMAAFAPEHSRVYSESPPPLAAIKACDLQPCNPHLHRILIQDVLYMMGRTKETEQPQYVFYKIQSIGSMNIDKFTGAFPRVPWIFLYRDSVEVMQSHVSGREDAVVNGKMTPVCARNYGRKIQPPTTLQVIEKAGVLLDQMNPLQYCAAHLAGLSLSAIQEHTRTHRGRFVNYKQMPDIVWDDIFPNYFNIPLTNKEIGRMEKTALLYSKGRGNQANKGWKDDSTEKQKTAARPVTKAAAVFLKDVYDDMERLSKKGKTNK
jgi:hypothetical protein